MVNKATKEKQLEKPKNRDVIIGAGGFTVPVSYKWTCTKNIVHILTLDRYRGIVTVEIPIETLREILQAVDKAKVNT
jgi:hypothetical protein